MRPLVFCFHRAFAGAPDERTGTAMQQSLIASLVLSAIVALSPFPAAAQLELNPSHPETYTVRRGDTLWGIAGRFLTDPWRWPQLWDSNREIDNPDLIYPGDVLTLYYRDGQPRVGLRGGMRTVRLSPRVRATPLKDPIPTIPIGDIRPFFNRTYILDKSQIEDSPYVVAFADEHIVAGVGDLAYVRSIHAPAGGAYDLVRPGDAYKDPDSGEILGYTGRFVAEVELLHPGDPARVRITDMELEAGIGDRVFSAQQERPQTSFLPTSAPRGVEGRIISVFDGVSQIGQYRVVVLDVGTGQGVQPGHVFDVFNGGERVRDVGKDDVFRRDWKNQRFWSQETWYSQYRVDGFAGDPPVIRLRKESGSVILPYERAGRLMVFRSFDRVSFGLVLDAQRPMFLLDAVRPPPA